MLFLSLFLRQIRDILILTLTSFFLFSLFHTYKQSTPSHSYKVSVFSLFPSCTLSSSSFFSHYSSNTLSSSSPLHESSFSHIHAVFLLLSHTHFLFSFSLHLMRFLSPPHIYTVSFFSLSHSNKIFFSTSVSFSLFVQKKTRYHPSSHSYRLSFSLFLPLTCYLPPSHFYTLSLFVSPSYAIFLLTVRRFYFFSVSFS